MTSTVRRLPAAFPVTLAATVALAVLAPAAQARNVRLLEPVNDAARATKAHQILGNITMQFGGASASLGEIVRRDVTVVGEGSTKLADVGEDDSVRPSDHDLCARAFEAAVTKFAFAARDAHASAIVGVVSYSDGKVMDDPDHFECHAGTLKANVTLRGQLVRGAVGLPSAPPAVIAPPPAPIPVAPVPAPLPAYAPPPPAPTFQPLPPAPSPSPN